MKYGLLIFIKTYWFFKPILPIRTCLFHKSCSHYVYDETLQNGFLKGIAAMKSRIKSCRPGYFFFTMPDGKQVMVTSDKKVWEMDLVSDTLFTL